MACSRALLPPDADLATLGGLDHPVIQRRDPGTRSSAASKTQQSGIFNPSQLGCPQRRADSPELRDTRRARACLTESSLPTRSNRWVVRVTAV